MEASLRRKRAHDVAGILSSIHMNGSPLHPEAFVIARRYVDGEISASKMAAALSGYRGIDQAVLVCDSNE